MWAMGSTRRSGSYDVTTSGEAQACFASVRDFDRATRFESCRDAPTVSISTTTTGGSRRVSGVASLASSSRIAMNSPSATRTPTSSSRSRFRSCRKWCCRSEGTGSAAHVLGFTFGRPRRLSGTLTAEYGEFFDGHRTALTVSRSLVELSPSLTLEPNVSVNWIDLDEGAFTTTLVAARATYTLTPFAFFGALLQYNSSNDSLGANLRLRWEYQPGSELFVVYNEQRDTLTPRFPELENRAFIIKINRLFRF